MDDVHQTFDTSPHAPGHCFWLVADSESLVPCSSPVEFEGRFRDWRGTWHSVEACSGHAGHLTDWSRIKASVIDISTARKRSRSPYPGPLPA